MIESVLSHSSSTPKLNPLDAFVLSDARIRNAQTSFGRSVTSPNNALAMNAACELRGPPNHLVQQEVD